MNRPIFLIAGLLVLGGCDKATNNPAAESAAAYANALPMAAMRDAKKVAPVAGPKLAYSHNLSIETPSKTVKQRFEETRDACLTGAIPGCVLLEANIQDDSEGERQPTATLEVRLAHDAVAPFEQKLLKPLPGERPDEVSVMSRATSAEDLTAAIQDGDRRLSQLSDYRDRLSQLAKRADAKVDDLIKVESEISSTQSQIEALTAEQHGLNERVDTERLTAQITGRSDGPKIGRIAEIWRNAGKILDSNIADALQFLISAVPWLAVVVLTALLLPLARILLGFLWRVGRRRGAP